MHVISDMFVSSKLYSEADFQTQVESDQAIGFTPFVPFVQGDYVYTTAIYRISMHATSGDRGVIRRLQVDVDVPDMFDRGDTIVRASTWTAGVVRVLFTRPFHISPIVVVSIQSADDATATVKVVDGSTDRFGFNAYINAGGAKIEGAFTWAAHGY